MRVGDITAALEAFAPLRIQEDWDNSGLCIGSPEDEVCGVLIGFDCTAELLDEAVEKGCDMVITHHPLLFKGIRQIRPGDPVSDAVIRAVRAGISVYAAHTTADKVIEGVSGAMARRLGLTDIAILEDEGGYGLGAVGNLPCPMTGSEALAYVKEKFGLEVVRSSRPLETPFRRVALCGGSGGSEIPAAIRSGADLYISADISYHHFFTPKGFMVMDIGHFESEVEIVEILCKVIREKFPTFAVRISDTLGRSNPVRYYY
ncbi:MAG: Nif3-like dinuclear metal center hexameric protein [Bacteroidales bacterium]|nr:Nif3-like dinuclear metal center hexameric protein [Bacteroidales bacterium]MBR1706498.1 Nif3-like dinuclear metal center hexameric protein [Bacteroidales bacterium]